jgi:LPS-assembly protein
MMGIYQQIGRSAKIFLLSLIAATSNAITHTENSFDDWITSNTCSKNANRLCHGYYKQPHFPDTTGQVDNQQPITITSDEANFVSKGTSVFIGNVIAVQGDKMIYADKATVEHNAESGQLETITATGNVKIMQPGLRVDGSKAVAHIATDRKVIDNAVYRLYERHARGTADILVVNGQNKMDLIPASYTTCAPESNAWYLKASETDFNKETGRGEAWHAKMYLKDIPVFYWPYVNFPIDKRRQTGFLMPDYKRSTTNGQTAIFPFYWNIAPNYDSTITTNYMSLRGAKFDSLWRYLTPSSTGNISFDFLPYDKAYKVLRQQALASPAFVKATDSPTVLRRNDLKDNNFRYRYAWKNSTQLSPNVLFTVDYSNAGDGDYLNDFVNAWNNSSPMSSTIYALQTAALQYGNFLGSAKLQVEEYKSFHAVNGPTSATQQLRKLPELTLNSATFSLPYGFNWLVNSTSTSFKPRLLAGDTTQYNYGQRFQMRPALMYPIMEPGWFVQPRVQFNQVSYSHLHISPTAIKSGTITKGTTVTIPMYDIKTGLIFDRPTQFKNTALLQTLEPTLYYLYVPNKVQTQLPNFDSAVINFDYNQVFRDNSYSGLDRVARANQLGMGLATKFFSEYSGEEIGMLGVGQIRYVRPNIVPLNETNNLDKHWSPVAMVARMRVAPKYNIETNWVRDNVSTKTASVQLQYRGTPTRIFNVGYELVRSTAPDDLTGQYQSEIKQVVASTAWQITPPMRMLGKAGYDLQYHHALNLLAGLEYHTCCTAVRFIWTKDWQPGLSKQQGQYVYSIGLRLIFKGFAGVGGVEDSYLAQAIPGYTSQD